MTSPGARPTRLFYVDDSGAERSGLATYSWIELTLEQWSPALCQVLDWRDALSEAHGIPKGRELHAVEFANGRGNPSVHGDEWNRRKSLRRQVMDGDGTDASYLSAHRGLAVRRRSLIEDPFFQHSARSQWVQIADLVAYAGYQSVAQLPQKKFTWHWYPSLAPALAEPMEV